MKKRDREPLYNFILNFFIFLLDFASKRKACCKSKNTIVTTKWKLRLWMKMQAGKHADKNKHARSRPTVKMQMQTANSNWNATLWSLLCSLKNSSLLIPPTRTYVASGALSVCVFYVVIAFHDTNSNGLCSATHCVASWNAERGEGWRGEHTPRQKKKMRARILRARVCVCVCVAWVILFSIISFCYFVFYLICLHTIIRTNFYFCFIHVLALQIFPRMRNRNTRTKNDDDFRMLLLL